jgi:hypothetical protein
MNKKLAKSQKKLKKTQKKLKSALRDLANVPKAENPAWVTALATIAGAVATALADQDKRGQLANVASEAKDKAVGLLTKGELERKPKEEREEAPASERQNGIVTEEKSGAV